MVDLANVPHHPAIEEIAEVLSIRTQNEDTAFFRTVSAYFLSIMAATMRTSINTRDRGQIPVNAYVMALAPSGAGKGYSVRILEDEFCKGFRKSFNDYTLPILSEANMWKISMNRAAMNGTEEQAEFEGLEKEYKSAGEFMFVFSDGTVAALRQLREKLLIADVGSINYQVDEIGSNLVGQTEMLNAYLELYDQGEYKGKLIKNGVDNKRSKPIEGKTPTNMMLFGTASKLLDNGATENAFYSFLDTGYARRCIFAMGNPKPAADNLSAKDIYEQLASPALTSQINKWATHFTYLADPNKLNWLIDVPDDVAIELLQYKLDCEAKSREIPEHDEIRKAELSHRYYKTLRLAGAYAFVDEVNQLSMYHLHAAMKLVEESGRSFSNILTREKSYMKLARFIAAEANPVTHADILASLPFYTGGKANRSELMTLATAWGYKQHIQLKKNFVEGIELFSGETLKETSLDSLKVSHSDDYGYHYLTESIAFENFHELTQMPDYNWASHGFERGHRCGENVLAGFNMVVLDVDGTCPINIVHDLLEDYAYMTHTTKSHTAKVNRFRIVIPMSYELKLDEAEYKEFMTNIKDWLPFDVDEATFQRCRKWSTCETGTYHYGPNSELLDVLPFVPKTTKNEQYREKFVELESLDNLERWFAQRIADGNRNNQMLKFALTLVDAGMQYIEVEEKVLAFNEKLSDKLTDTELRTTVLVTVARKLDEAA